jgi:hypothetical protein
MRTSGETGSGAGTAKSEVLDLAAFATVRTDVAAALSDAAALASADPSDVARGYAVLAQATELAGDPALAISLWGDAIQTKGLPPNVLAEYRTSLAAIPSLEQSARLEHLQAAKRYYDEAPSVPESVRVRLMEAAISPPKEAARLAAEAHALATNRCSRKCVRRSRRCVCHGTRFGNGPLR